MAPKTKGKPRKSGSGNRNKPVSNSVRAGTLFPVGRLNRMIKKGRYSDRVGSSAGAFMAAVLEYITAEVLELAGNICEEHKKKTIAPKHINLGLKSDDELNKLMVDTTIFQGGMLLNIHEALRPQKGKKGEAMGSQAI